MYECSKSNGNIFVKTKNTCYFPLDRVWNIHLETTENSISRFLDFNIFWGSKLPRETPRGSRLWRWQYFPLLRNIRIGTNTPSQTPATRLIQMAQYSNKSTRKESSPEDYICIFFPSFAFIRRVRSIAKKKGIVQVQYCAWLSVCHFIVSNTKWS